MDGEMRIVGGVSCDVYRPIRRNFWGTQCQEKHSIVVFFNTIEEHISDDPKAKITLEVFGNGRAHIMVRRLGKITMDQDI